MINRKKELQKKSRPPLLERALLRACMARTEDDCAALGDTEGWYRTITQRQTSRIANATELPALMLPSSPPSPKIDTSAGSSATD